MTHPRDELTALLDGALAPGREEELRRHLTACAECRAEEARLRGALALLAALPPAPEPSPFFAARLEARLAARRERGLASWARLLAGRWRLAVPATALAAAALLSAVVVRHDRARERAVAEHLDLLLDYEAVASVDLVESPEDAQVVAHLGELEGRP
ncbi:MAG TPA: zf-HC2 domain-containing protein [Anaeromyxobacter sp.]|nr:zf-HC2 domain-containing protein [Anaeromyxobacter sp.]